MILSNSPSRVGIYVFYDPQGVVDDYVVYQLDDLRKNLDYLLVVVNGQITEQGHQQLGQLSNQILMRENQGFDAWAYKEGMEYLGWSEISQYDELLLANDTCFGPVYPFSETFEAMNKRDVDFWSLTKAYGLSYDPTGLIPYGYVPEYLQSYFICIRKPMLTNQRFMDYWQNLHQINAKIDAVGWHEAVFTQTFKDLGYTSDTYVNTEDLKQYTSQPLELLPKELVQNRKYPVFKRKLFYKDIREEDLDISLNQATVDLYQYLKEHSNYDLKMVWDNILRTNNLADITKRMNLSFVLPKDYLIDAKPPDPKVALVFYSDAANAKDYLNNVTANISIYPVSSAKDAIAELEGIAAEFDLICFVCDAAAQDSLAAKSWQKKCFDNVLGSANYISNIVTTFNSSERLGVLIPPKPSNIYSYNNFGSEWSGQYKQVQDLLTDLNLIVNIQKDKEAVAPFGGMFWLRPEAIAPLIANSELISNHNIWVILHSICYIAQSQGFYSAWVMNDRYASIELTTLYTSLGDTLDSKQNQIAQNKALKNTLSWKITKPLRLLRRIFKSPK